jgi:hypothetical protein
VWPRKYYAGRYFAPRYFPQYQGTVPGLSATQADYGIIVGGYNRMGQQGPTIGGVM